MLPMRSLAKFDSKVLAVNRVGAISFHDRDHGDGRDASQGGALAWLDALLHSEGITDAKGRRGYIATHVFLALLSNL